MTEDEYQALPKVGLMFHQYGPDDNGKYEVIQAIVINSGDPIGRLEIHKEIVTIEQERLLIELQRSDVDA